MQESKFQGAFAFVLASNTPSPRRPDSITTQAKTLTKSSTGHSSTPHAGMTSTASSTVPSPECCDAGDWARSVRATIWHPHFLEKHWLFRLLLGKRAQDMCRMYRERFFGGAEPSLDDVDALKRAFRAHEARVRRTVPADRLLVHRATDGWAPLCAFLGKPIPDAPYPRVNDAASFRRHIHLVQAFLVVFYGGLVVAGGYVVRRLCR